MSKKPMTEANEDGYTSTEPLLGDGFVWRAVYGEQFRTGVVATQDAGEAMSADALAQMRNGVIEGQASLEMTA